MSIGRIRDCQGERLTQTRQCRDQSSVSIPMDGKATAEASITRQGQADSPKKSARCGIQRKSANGTSRETICCFVVLSAPRLADLSLSLPPSAFRSSDSAQLASGQGQNRSTYPFSIDTFLAVTSRTQNSKRMQSTNPCSSVNVIPQHRLSRLGDGKRGKCLDKPPTRAKR